MLSWDIASNVTSWPWRVQGWAVRFCPEDLAAQVCSTQEIIATPMLFDIFLLQPLVAPLPFRPTSFRTSSHVSIPQTCRLSIPRFVMSHSKLTKHASPPWFDSQGMLGSGKTPKARFERAAEGVSKVCAASYEPRARTLLILLGSNQYGGTQLTL